ncbi:mesoderm induction early response protein 2 isoform X1 [Syngnathus acus]|uniref:mesoderm induction early response protein 2 isoform X1 n=1 Tax=Syngnathus acus TaxID=161584 RepID=UPI001885F7BB|nr:mesoderm induction early response protein 2 isoform X1 [Syngnathus acus]XP_037105044.1 mesoderm induction early response protein 2 isoform X1 [Syngnathus acus]
MAAQSQAASELPLEELLALYGFAVPDPAKQSCHVSAALPDVTVAKNQIPEDIFAATEGVESSADDLTPSVTSSTSDLLQHLPPGNNDASVCSSDEEPDNISVPSNEEHKDIMVGSMYQAIIPPLSPYTYREQAYHNEDQLLWRPGALPLLEVEHFLMNVQKPRGQEGAVCKQTCADTVQDDEQALYELLRCNFNAEEALRRLHFNVKVFTEELCGWSEEECKNFELGYKVYGKNFHLIQANKVRTRSVGECVEYYYRWKKSERHDYFTQQACRITRKKYTLQLGKMEEGDQDGGYAGEMEGSDNSAALLSCGSSGKLPPPLPRQSSLELDKQDEEPQTGNVSRPQNLVDCPFPLPASSNQGARFSAVGAGPELQDHRQGFFQFHTRDSPFLPEVCGAAGNVTDSPVACRWDLTCCVPPLPHLMTSCPPPLHLSPFDSLQ